MIDVDWIPRLFFKLASSIDWRYEQQCLDDITACVAECYSLHSASENHIHKIQNVLFPRLKNLIPPTRFQSGVLFEVTSLEKLYRIFERC